MEMTDFLPAVARILEDEDNTTQTKERRVKRAQEAAERLRRYRIHGIREHGLGTEDAFEAARRLNERDRRMSDRR